MPGTIHVVPDGDRWIVQRERDDEPLSTFPSEDHAVDFGRDQARNERSELVVHDRNGDVRDRHSFGNDPGDATA